MKNKYKVEEFEDIPALILKETDLKESSPQLNSEGVEFGKNSFYPNTEIINKYLSARDFFWIASKGDKKAITRSKEEATNLDEMRCWIAELEISVVKANYEEKSIVPGAMLWINGKEFTDQLHHIVDLDPKFWKAFEFSDSFI